MNRRVEEVRRRSDGATFHRMFVYRSLTDTHTHKQTNCFDLHALLLFFVFLFHWGVCVFAE